MEGWDRVRLTFRVHFKSLHFRQRGLVTSLPYTGCKVECHMDQSRQISQSVFVIRTI